jgi:OmpA-OmpF porin, OOP family
MKAKFVFLMIPLAALSFSAFAQSDKVLGGKDITESALIQALTPGANSGDTSTRTRSIRVSPENASVGATVKPASASLLITFETNSAALTPRAKQSLDVVGEALASNKLSSFRFSILGFADPRGDSEANMRLSQLRAESVRQYLVQSKHIDESRLEAVGKGDKELINSANPAAPENRRVTIINLAQ